jgi:hypothetical protein
MTISVVWAGVCALPVLRTMAAAHAPKLVPLRVRRSR